MMNHKRLTFWVAAATIFSIATFASAAGSYGATDKGTINGVGPKTLVEPTKPITITYAGAAYTAKDLKPVLDAFMKAHPNITVKYESVPFNDFNSVLAARLTNAKGAIDVFDVDMPRTTSYQARGWLSDLSATFPQLKTFVDPGSLAAAKVGGKTVTMPYQTSTNIMYYNKKLLAAAGVANPSASPSGRLTWETVTDYAQKAKAAGAKYGIVFDQIDRYYQLQPLAESAGGGPGASGVKNLTPTVNNAGWIKAFTWYGSLFAKGLSPRGVAASDTPNLFASGQTAFYVGGPWWAGQFAGMKDLEFGVAPFPAFAGGKAATPTSGWSLGLNPKTTAAKANAVGIFMKFMGLDNGGYAQYLTALYVPPSNVAGGAKFFGSDVFKDPRLAGVVDLMKSELAKTTVLRLQTVGYVEFEDIMTKTFSDIINGTDASTALGSAASDLKDSWKRYK